MILSTYHILLTIAILPKKDVKNPISTHIHGNTKNPPETPSDAVQVQVGGRWCRV